MHDLDLQKLRVELVRAGWTQRLLAGMLDTPPTTLSGWLNNTHPGPRDLPQRIADALEVPVSRIARGRRAS